MEPSFYKELYEELTTDILPYWQEHARDESTGGFYGAISNGNVPDGAEWRGIVMVARYLWSYSAAARLLRDASYLDMADYAYRCLAGTFADAEHGGLYWSVNPDGTPRERRKQVYGNAFAIYGMSEYAAALHELRPGPAAGEALDRALGVFRLLEAHARDRASGGYAEALTQDWRPTTDTRLSEKDIDCAKSMNTNLHVMEAYTTLHRALPLVCPERAEERQASGEALRSLARVHVRHILGAGNHLRLYFNQDWTPTGPAEISYGHDIEASWLLWEAATELGDAALQEELRPVVLAVARTALDEGYDPATGGFENACLDGVRDTARIWWGQAEALNGFYNAWEMLGGRTGGAGDAARYADAVRGVWRWVQEHQRDREHGEWFWEVARDGTPNPAAAKGGNWKTSYHNARCCMELLRRGAPGAA